MATQIFVNLPVKDLNRSVEFFTKVGHTFNAQFTDENATSMVIAENIYVMLLVESFFKTLVGKEICDTTTSAESVICLSAKSREAVDELVARAAAAGGVAHTPTDYGFMYQSGYQDLDGHAWVIMYMSPDVVQQS